MKIISGFLNALILKIALIDFGYDGLKPSSLVLALSLAVCLVSCAAKDMDGPVINTDAVTPGTSAAAKENVPAAPDSEGAAPLPPGTYVASASRDEDTWFLVTDVNSERKFSVYVDTSTIQPIEGEIYSWSKLVFKEDQKDSDGLVYREVMISSSINCAGKTYSYKSSKFYDSLGRMVFMENIATGKSKIPENSVSGNIADFVCGYNPSEAKKAAPAQAKPQQKSK